jgi:hypothetical protein
MAQAPTTEALTGWLRKQPPEGEYVWSDPVYCLMGHYCADNEMAWGMFQYSDMPGYFEIAAEKPWTFGAALERAEKLALPPPPLQIAAPVRELETVDAG